MYQESEQGHNRLPTPPNAGHAPTEANVQGSNPGNADHRESIPPNQAGESKNNFNGEVSPQSPKQGSELNGSKAPGDGDNTAASRSGELDGTLQENNKQQNNGGTSNYDPEQTHVVNGENDQNQDQPQPQPQKNPEEQKNQEQNPAQEEQQQKQSNSAKVSVNDQLFPQLKNEHSSQLLSQYVDAKSANNHAVAAAAVAALNEHNGLDTSRVSLALLLEASAAAAEAEKNAEKQQLDPEILRKCAEDRAETDKYITDAIHRVQTTPRDERSIDLRPLDRRDTQVPTGWSRFTEIHKDAQLLGECRRLVRGTQGCGRECDAKFTNLIDFAKHVDEMHDVNFRPFLCPQERCPWGIIGFHERSECTRHIRTKHYRAMYACEYQGCTKVYNRSDAFRRHVRQAHANPGSRFNRLTQRSDDTKN